MYIDVVPNRQSPPAILLRESYREGGKVKKRTLANLSHLDALRVEVLRRALRGDFDQLTAAEAVSGPVFAVLFVLKQVADQIGLSRALGRDHWAKLALFLVFARIAHGGSRLSACRWAENQAVEEVLGLKAFREEDLYETLDRLEQQQERIEQRLYQDYVERRGQAPLLFLYDLTSTYLEGEQNELAAFGYSRDGKRGKRQIVVGLLTDRQGEPLAVRVFSGNTADPSTLAEQIDLIRQRFRVQEVVFIGDGGMIKTPGKQALTEVGWRYITALSQPEIRNLLRRDVLQLGLFDEQVCQVEAGGVRYVLRRNETEARRFAHRLEDKLSRLQQQLAARNQQVADNRRCEPQAGLRRFEKWVEQYKLKSLGRIHLEGRQLLLELDAAAWEQALQLAGCYVLETDVTADRLSAQDVHDRYKDLSRVEWDWRTLKGHEIEIRPVYVRKESRTRGHVFVCFLALKLVRELNQRLQAAFQTTDTNRRGVTLSDALQSLSRLCLTLYPVPGGGQVPLLPTPDERQQKILDALGVPLPKKIHV
jgi:transposase